MTVVLSSKYWENPRFRRFYVLLWVGIALVVGALVSQVVPSGTLQGCEVDEVAPGPYATVIESSCGEVVSYQTAASMIRAGGTYDFSMQGFIVRHVASWEVSPD